MAHAPKRVLTIRPLSRAVAIPDDFFARTWGALREFIRAVHALQHTAYSFEQLYGSVTDLVLAKHGAELYQCVKAEMDAHVGTALDAEATRSQTLDATASIASFAALWGNHCSQVILIRNVFLYLDRTASGGSKAAFAACQRIPLVDVYPAAARVLGRDSGVSSFRRLFAERKPLLHRTTRSFVSLVADDRRGALVDRAVLAAVMRAFTSLGLYASELEPPLLRDADTFYEAELRALLDRTDVAAHLTAAENRLVQERERARAFLDPSTARPLIAIVESRLIGSAVDQLLDRGFATLMDSGKRGDIRRMYVLLSLVRRVDALRRAFAEYAKARAARVVAGGDEERDRVMVQTLLAYREEMERALTESFSSDETFAAALKTAIEFGINSRENKPAELIAKFIDAQMRAGVRHSAPHTGGGSTAAPDGAATSIRGTADEELDAVMDKVMTLFRGIHSKDVFEAFYKKDLAKRLLLGKSSSTDAEKAMVARLKAECGAAFTSKLEGMFKDVEGSAELMTQFATAREAADRSLGAASVSLPDLHVHVLTSSYWPTFPLMPGIILPGDLAPAHAEFERFYSHKYSSGRRLQWQHSLGHCIVRAVFPTGRKELDVSLFQTLVLLLFNVPTSSTAGTLAFSAIHDRTGIEHSELRRTLQSVACGTHRVLRKEPAGRDVNDSDVFSVNLEFRAALVRIKINSIQMKETKEEADTTNERVVQDRQYQIDAAIVRIMKTRKRLNHNALMSELFPMLRFTASAADLKKRIESLIERDYLERTDGDATVYTYLA